MSRGVGEDIFRPQPLQTALVRAPAGVAGAAREIETENTFHSLVRTRAIGVGGAVELVDTSHLRSAKKQRPLVDPGKVKASYRDGLLQVVLPKAEEAKPKQIEVALK